MTLSFVTPSAGVRVDRLLAETTGCGRRRARQLLAGGSVRIDGHRVRAGELVRAGQRVEVVAHENPQPASTPAKSAAGEHSAALPEALRVLAESATLMAIFKPAGVHSHRGLNEPTAADFVESTVGCQAEVGLQPHEAGIVHRLDRDTSGILLVARTRPVYLALRKAFSAGDSLKFYLALVDGKIEERSIVDRPLARRAHRMVAAGPHDNALPARTSVEPLESGSDWTLVQASMRSGVTHQIRAHMALIGHALIGDSLYATRPAPHGTRTGQLLHAARIVVPGLIDVSAPTPADFVGAYAALRRLPNSTSHSNAACLRGDVDYATS